MSSARTLRNIKKDNKEYIKQEHERLRKIHDFQKGDTVQLMYHLKILNGIIQRINIKTYSVQTNDDYILINKETLTGYSKELINDISGDGRRYIGELYRLKKDNK